MKLIVSAPSGKHEITEISVGGSYYDTTRILWNELINGILPVKPEGYVLSESWQTDPMNPEVCWRAKTTQELDSEKTTIATRECGKKELTAIVLWICQKLGIAPSMAKSEIIDIWKGLP